MDLIACAPLLRELTKIARVMRLTATILLAISLQLSARTVSQTITLSGDHLSVELVFSEIEKQTGYLVVCSADFIHSVKSFSVSARKEPIDNFIAILLKGLPFTYSIQNTTIVIRRVAPPPDPGLQRSLAEAKPPPVTGIILGPDGLPMAGVNIVVKNTGRGVVSDDNGKFSIDAESGQVLLISFVGYQTQEVTVEGNAAALSIQMVEGSNKLEGIVVVGYTSQKRKDLTSAIGSVDMENAQKRAVTDVTQSLQGNVAGVQVTQSDGNPGSAVNFNIRGIGGIGNAGGNAPLVIVDGVQITGIQFHDWENLLGDNFGETNSTGLENLNPTDIQSIEILKDASASAIYGSRAANGVVIVTTKRGKRGSVTVNYDSYVGVQSPYKNLSVMNSAQYVGVLQQMYGDDLSGDPNAPQAAKDYLENPSSMKDYNWQDMVYKDAMMQSHTLAISGGGPFGNYRVSAGYLDQKGITLGTSYKRYNVRGNADFNVNKWLKVGQSISLASTLTLPEAFAWSRSMAYNSIVMYPYYPDKLPDGSWNTTSFYYGGGEDPEAHVRNPFHYKSIWNRQLEGGNLAANMYAEMRILDGLSYRLSGSYSLAQLWNHEQFGDKGANQDEYGNDNKQVNERFTQSSNWNIDNVVRYNKMFGMHTLNLMGGFVAQKFRERFFYGFKNNFLSPNTETLNGPGGTNAQASGALSENTLLSLIGQVFYAYDERYLLTVNFRRDRSSRFSPAVRAGNFPGISVGWRVSNESFWKNSALIDVVSNLKLRAGYGELGRQNTGDYDYQATLAYVPVVLEGAIRDGLITRPPINRDITWETLISRNVGVDFELFNGKIDGSVEIYNQRNNGMIIGVPNPGSIGGGTFLSNVGQIKNHGVELTLNYSKNEGAFLWRAGFNLTTVNTRLTNIGSDIIYREELAPEWDVPPAIIVYQGRGPAEFWLIKTDGIFKTQKEIDDYKGPDGQPVQPNAQPGDIRFIDYNNDGTISEEGDRQYAGSGIPKLNAGFNFSAQYGKFDLNLGLYGSFGAKIMNGSLYLLEKPYGYTNKSTTLLNAFDPVSNPNSDFPRLNPNDLQDNWNSRPTSDRYLEKGDYVKIRNIELGYRISRISDRISFRNTRVFVRTQNLFTISAYSGHDPEVGRDGFWNAGIDRGMAPQARSFQVGINLEF